MMSDTSDPLEILDAIDRERGDSSIGMIQSNQVQRLRDEIVGLLELVGRQRAVLLKGHAEVRDEALEEAARECDEEAKGSGGEVAFRDGCETCAAAIRLLKEKH